MRPGEKKKPPVIKELLFNLASVVDTEGNNIYLLASQHYYNNTLAREKIYELQDKNPSSREHDDERNKLERQRYVVQDLFSWLFTTYPFQFLKDMINLGSFCRFS